MEEKHIAEEEQSPNQEVNGAGAQLASIPRYSGCLQMVERNPKSDFFSFQSSIFRWGHQKEQDQWEGVCESGLVPQLFQIPCLLHLKTVVTPQSIRPVPH